MILKKNLVFKMFHVYTHINKSEILPVLSLLIARSFNTLPRKIQFFSSNFLMRNFPQTDSFHRFLSESPENIKKLSVYGKFPHPEVR